MIQSFDLVGGGMAHYQYDTGKQRTRKRIDEPERPGRHWETHLPRRLRAVSPLQRQRRNLVEEIESHHLFEGEQRVLLVDDVIKHANGQRTPMACRFKNEPLFRYQYSNHLGSACLELDRPGGDHFV